jgi:hypothetical protein
MLVVNKRRVDTVTITLSADEAVELKRVLYYYTDPINRVETMDLTNALYRTLPTWEDLNAPKPR